MYAIYAKVPWNASFRLGLSKLVRMSLLKSRSWFLPVKVRFGIVGIWPWVIAGEKKSQLQRPLSPSQLDWWRFRSITLPSTFQDAVIITRRLGVEMFMDRLLMYHSRLFKWLGERICGYGQSVFSLVLQHSRIVVERQSWWLFVIQHQQESRICARVFNDR